jgi:hypothetical protein
MNWYRLLQKRHALIIPRAALSLRPITSRGPTWIGPNYRHSLWALTIEHERPYADAFGHKKLDRGVSIATVENFLVGKAEDSVKQKLRDVLLTTTK